MTWFLVSVSCRITGILGDKHHQMFFHSRNFLFISDNEVIEADINQYVSLWRHKPHWTDLLQIPKWRETHPTCSQMYQDSSWVECASWLLLIPFWLEANYIFFMTSHLFWWSSSSPSPHRQIMAAKTRQQSEKRSESSRSTVASCIVFLVSTKQQCWHQLVHHGTANAATDNMTQDTHFKIVRTTGNSMPLDVSISISR